MALSQVGEYLEQDTDIIQPVRYVAPLLLHANPKVRFGVCQFLGQLSNDMKPFFQ